MAAITAQMVKDLREKTSAGMMDCKKALQECDGDMAKATDWLRQKGLSQAAKKAHRATSEGMVAFAANDAAAALVEIKCETDFVARGDKFQAFAAQVANTVLEKAPADDEALQALIGEDLKAQIGVLGENMSVGRFVLMAKPESGAVGSYVHSNGKIGVLVEMTCSNPAAVESEKFKELMKNVAMQVAAACPLALDSNGLDPDVVAREREVYRKKTLEEGKPEKIVDKIVDGRMQKFFQDACLLDQAFIRDDKMNIRTLLAQEGKELGGEVTIVRFARLQLGEDA